LIVAAPTTSDVDDDDRQQDEAAKDRPAGADTKDEAVKPRPGAYALDILLGVLGDQFLGLGDEAGAVDALCW
jgi:hypothetical protein